MYDSDQMQCTKYLQFFLLKVLHVTQVNKLTKAKELIILGSKILTYKIVSRENITNIKVVS